MSLPFCDTGIEVVCRATRGTGIIASQTLWVIDFLSNLIGHPLTGLTDYMFMADHSLFLRGLSLFHGWLPFLLVYWTVVAWALLLILFFLMPPPRPDPGLTPVNIGS